MIKKLSLIGAAVAGAMAAAPSMALPIASANEGTNGVVKFIVSGSSAFQGAFEAELNLGAASSICKAGTYNKYTASVTTGTAPGLAAYSCTSVASLFGSEKPTIIYYRSEGGSVYGLTPLVVPSVYRPTVPQVLRLALTASCGASSCLVGDSYDPVSDTLTNQTANAVDATSDLGLADEEAGMFVGSNYPSSLIASKLQPALSAGELAGLTGINTRSFSLVLQSFGVFTHLQTSSPTTADTQFNGLTSLSREVIADIYRGKWNDWAQVPKNDGSNATVTSASLPIVACRREPGSGTQVAASVFLHKTNCGGADEFVTSATPVNLSTVSQQTTTGNMRSCISNNPGAIGYLSAEADAAGRKLIQIDGKGAPTTANNLGIATASGDYGFAFHMIAIKRSGISNEQATLATKLIGLMQDQTTGPTTGNVTFLPTGNNAGNAVFPLTTPANKQPVSCFQRADLNSCAELSDAC